MKDPFAKLIDNCKMNAIFKKEDGTWDIKSPNCKKRLNGYGWHGVGWASSKDKNKKGTYPHWDPPKLLVTAKDLETIWIQQKGLCFWFEIPLDLGLLFKNHSDWYSRHPLAPSVDRKNDDGDYTTDNIVICCRFANWGRSIYPFDKTKKLVALLRGKEKISGPLEDFMA